MVDIYTTYVASNKARMVTIYVEEAHASDEWVLPDAAKPVSICQPTTTAQRLEIANMFVKDHAFPIPMLVDPIEGAANDRYDAAPERLFVVRDGVIVYHGGPGPFYYRLAEVAQWLKEHTA
jgi:type I thyroxine 5'-deiodinase